MDDPAAQRKLAKKLERQQVGGRLGSGLHASGARDRVGLCARWDLSLLFGVPRASAGCFGWCWSQQGCVATLVKPSSTLFGCRYL